VFEEAEAAVALSRLVLADAGVQREAAERKVRDLRLHLIMENISNIRAQRALSVMVPWTRVRRLLASAPRAEVLRQVAQERFTRWPVVEPGSGRALGYLLTKDLIADAADGDWTRLIRPLQAIPASDDIESTLLRMQRDGATIYLVEQGGSPLGIITVEDILEQVVGRIEDEYPHETVVTLRDVVVAGGVLLDVAATTREAAIRELAEAIHPDALPVGVEPEEIGRLALVREAEYSTDLGQGVAVPHARCPGLRAPLVVFGRAPHGILFSSETREAVRLVFLLVTPTERPDIQLMLLGIIAGLAGRAEARERLLHAESVVDVLDALMTPAGATPP
jgi:mannitol/fructose-specific phosphotransferase system IIA component (Ntr-type)